MLKLEQNHGDGFIEARGDGAQVATDFVVSMIAHYQQVKKLDPDNAELFRMCVHNLTKMPDIWDLPMGPDAKVTTVVLPYARGGDAL